MGEVNMESMGKRIAELRKAAGMTQEVLAEMLGITYQAVSKWENNGSLPDISLLPKLADIFQVRIDSLFGREDLQSDRETAASREECGKQEETLTQEVSAMADPGWKDDGTIRIVLFEGRRLVDDKELEAGILKPLLNGAERKIIFSCDRDIEGDIISHIGVECKNVKGNIMIKGSGAISCSSIEGNISSGSSAAINTDKIIGSVSAGSSVVCKNVEGNVNAGSSVKCEQINGDVSAGSSVKAVSINGQIKGGKAAGQGVEARSREKEEKLERKFRKLEEKLDVKLSKWSEREEEEMKTE